MEMYFVVFVWVVVGIVCNEGGEKKVWLKLILHYCTWTDWASVVAHCPCLQFTSISIHLLTLVCHPDYQIS